MKKDFICPECNKPRKNARMDAEVCSAKCRIDKFRRIKKEEHEARLKNQQLNRG